VDESRLILSAAILALAAVTANGTGSQDPGSSLIAELFIGDMCKPHDLRPQGIDAGWSRHARRGMRTLPDGWSCATMWGQIYPPEGGNPARNVRVQVRDARLWFFSRKDDQWRLVQSDVGVDGAAYRLDFAEDESVKADLRREHDGSVSVRLVPGRNFHFWPTVKGPMRVTLDPEDVGAMASSFLARLVVDDASQPDDREKARLIGSCGGDFWRSMDARWDHWKTNGDWAIGRFKLLTEEWQPFTGTNAEPDLLRQNAPLLELPAAPATEVMPPPPS
jgi:hypothetical protein